MYYILYIQYRKIFSKFKKIIIKIELYIDIFLYFYIRYCIYIIKNKVPKYRGN